MGCIKSSVKRDVYTNTNLPQETRKTSNEQPNLEPKATRNRRAKQKPQNLEKEEIIKIKSEINGK